MSPDSEPLKYDGWEGPIRNAAWLHDDRLVVLAVSDMKDVRVFDLRAGQAVTVLETAGVITDLQVHEGLLTVAAGKQVLSWDATSFAPVAAHTLDFPVFTASTCVGKKRFVAGGPDMWPRLYSAEGTELETFKGHHGPVHSIEFHPSGESFASGSEDGTIRLWSCSAPASDAGPDGEAGR
jgi:serine-threonine kinase receptor-associated protein